MNPAADKIKPGAGVFARAAALIYFLGLPLVLAQGASASFTNFVAQGDLAEKRGDVPGALKFYSEADRLQSTNAAELCLLTKRYCDLMHDTGQADAQKNLAERALACALRAVQADPKNATAHLCVAVSYGKNFPYVDSRTKIKWSKAIKSECETAIALDPRQDIAYYLLGRWNAGVANMNFFMRGLVKIIYGGLPKASNAEAIKNFKQAIVLAPDRIIHHFELAKVYELVGEDKLALAELKKCRTLKPVDRDDAEAQHEAAKKLASHGE